MDWIELLKNFGFPVFVACYLLIRFDGLLVAIEARAAHQSDQLDAMLVELRRVNGVSHGERANP